MWDYRVLQNQFANWQYEMELTSFGNCRSTNDWKFESEEASGFKREKSIYDALIIFHSNEKKIMYNKINYEYQVI